MCVSCYYNIFFNLLVFCSVTKFQLPAHRFTRKVNAIEYLSRLVWKNLLLCAHTPFLFQYFRALFFPTKNTISIQSNSITFACLECRCVVCLSFVLTQSFCSFLSFFLQLFICRLNSYTIHISYERAIHSTHIFIINNQPKGKR